MTDYKNDLKMIIDGTAFLKMVDEFCVEQRPKSKDIHDMALKCVIKKEPLLKPAEYVPDYDNSENVEDSIKLGLAVEIIAKISEELKTISMKDILQELMYLYDVNEDKLLK